MKNLDRLTLYQFMFNIAHTVFPDMNDVPLADMAEDLESLGERDMVRLKNYSPRQLHAFWVNEALEHFSPKNAGRYIDPDSIHSQIVNLRETIGNLHWLDSLPEDEFQKIENEILPIFEKAKALREK